MERIEKILAGMRQNPVNVRFADIMKVCEYFFGKARQHGTSHCVYKTPWPGDPRVNIQRSKGGKAKPYQVKQVLMAVDKLKGMKHGES